MSMPFVMNVRRGTKLTEKDWENAYTSAILQRYRETWSRKDPKLRRKAASEMATMLLSAARRCKNQLQTNEVLRSMTVSSPSAEECEEAVIMLDSLIVVREVDVRFVDDVQNGLKLWAGKTWSWLQKTIGTDDFTPPDNGNGFTGVRG